MKKQHVSVYLVGGGSGGHVSPLRALADELHEQIDEKSLRITFMCERGGMFDELMDAPYIQKKKKVFAGKFRRYHGDSFLSHITDGKTILLNIRDFFTFALGCLQSFAILLFHRPDVIFLKGGFVCVPVGFAARLLRVSYVTHDSDAIPGLANRLTAKGAVKNLVALDGSYPYPEGKTVVTGVPIDTDFAKLIEDSKREYRKKLGLPESALVLLVTGGGLGAQGMNTQVIAALNTLATSTDSTENTPELYVLHITGKALYEQTLDEYEQTSLSPDKIHVIDFTTDMLSHVGAADIVVSRAGATAIAELAAAKRPCIFIPGAHLTGGQQLHNAKVLDSKGAAIIILEQDTNGLVKAIASLASDPELRQSYGGAIASVAVMDSASKIVTILLEVADYQVASNQEQDSNETS